MLKTLGSPLFTNGDIFTTVYSELATYPDVTSVSGRVATDVRPLGDGEIPIRYYFRTNVPLGNATVLRYRQAATPMQLEHAPWIHRAGFQVVSAEDLRPGQRVALCGANKDGTSFEAVRSMNPLAVGILARDMEMDIDLVDLVVRVCRGLGMERVYDRKDDLGESYDLPDRSSRGGYE